LNPFYTQILPINAPFCNRTVEIKELHQHALNGVNVVLYSPRRYGKTSLVRKVQAQLAEEGVLTIYADFFGVTSIDDIATQLAKAVFEATRQREPLWKRALQTIKYFRPIIRPDEQSGFTVGVEIASINLQGIELLEQTMESLGKYIADSEVPVNIVLDEFQEITTLKDALKVEAVLRTHIQHHQASYFFVGSRRRTLLAIFNDQQRPFFQSAFNYPLPPLPKIELSAYLVQQFERGDRHCPPDVAEKIAETTNCHPCYTQKLAYLMYGMTEKEISANDIAAGMRRLQESERPVFEAVLQGLSLQQIRVLKTIAREPVKKPLGNDYLGRNRLGSPTGVSHSLKHLENLDLVEKQDNGMWRVVDPIMTRYLTGKNGNL